MNAPVRTSRFAAEIFAEWACGLAAGDIPARAREVARLALVDHVGLTVAARREPYVTAVVESCDGDGPCTAFGHARGFSAGDAALINGTASHGEDYDDTFEGNPIHTSTVVIPAVLAACERYGRTGADALAGIVAGAEFMCRTALIAPTAIHRAGFHPTAVIGALGAAAGAGVALGLNARQLTDALGIAGSMASGIIEYLAEGTWTKRLHPGWAAQAGLRAALLGRNGFLGPRSVIEGEHGFFLAFAAPGIERRYGALSDGLGSAFHMENIAFKPYACGTMAQPFVDCAIRIAEGGVRPEDIEDVLCRVGEGTVHRLWEPLSEKRRPSTPYSAKFSVPYCVAAGLVDRAAGLGQFTEERIADPALIALAAKVRYEIDPEDEYPRNYSGDVAVRLRDGSERRARQPHMRGGTREPLSEGEILAKFDANLAFGGLAGAGAELRSVCEGLFGMTDLAALARTRAGVAASV
ncbi:MmgE/PrpD family protein [Propylenella binzhouense]|uniref:MmgE/PrpD family protein n=1 Tax=Propylenella binzhouense TaxID=2555902 RepID=A0A964T7U6_9HYPH|nr:MmgE/PrpD family protein [Propylenella binzhouense]MYZ50146.1 MmgE/PrpD family protein [Propylenella binzhouense]